MIDLHAHLLPGVDDGAQTWADTAEMARIAREDGVDTIVITPHLRHELWPENTRESLEKLFTIIPEHVSETPSLALGAEIRVDSELLEEIDRFPHPQVLPLAGSRHLLLEFPSLPIGPDAREIVHELVVGGWFPVLAHPERIPWLAEDPDLLADLVERGALFQVTAMSVTGDFGTRPHACCAFLLDEGFVHFVASDAHNAITRPPRLSGAFRTIAEGWGEETARKLMQENPAAVLAGRPVEQRKAM